MPNRCRIGILKLGCIGAAPLSDLMLDERAERKDLEVVTMGTGAKLDPVPCQQAAAKIVELKPDIVVVISPNASLPGPTQARTHLLGSGLHVLSISDQPSKKAFYTKDDSGKSVPSAPKGSGFIILPMDPMIGARKEFLDPTEMTLFNAELIKLFSCTGVMRFVQSLLDKLVEDVKSGGELHLPTLSVTTEMALEAAGFHNPYAYAKAYAALKIAESIGEITSKACFKDTDSAVYVPAVAAAHEMLRAAARLADDAREVEKTGDSVLRTPHGSTGKTLKKTALHEKPV